MLKESRPVMPWAYRELLFTGILIEKQYQRVEKARPEPPLSLTRIERQNVIDILNSEEYQDKASYEIYAMLLDEGA